MSSSETPEVKVPDECKDEIEKLPKEEQELVLNHLLGALTLTDEEHAVLSAPVAKPLVSADIDGVAKYILDGHAKNIIVMTGAGISVSAGIPDFRSPGTGLYYNLQKYNLDDPQDVFSINYFRKNPKPFYCVAKGIYPGQFHPTKAHYFIRMLAEHGLLLRNFTQNIDTLEMIAGIPQDKVIYSHGSFSKSHCSECGKEYSYEDVREKVFADEVAYCECGGCIKPDITFFGEALPAEFFVQREIDFPKCDLLIVMGTSLVVHPFAGLITLVPENVPRLLINLEPVGCKAAPPGENASGYDLLAYRKDNRFAFNDPSNLRDAYYKGTIDDGVEELAKALGWEKELQALFDTPIEGIKKPEDKPKEPEAEPKEK